MTTAPKSTAAKPRSSRPLDEAAIVAAAVRVIRKRGTRKLGMRSLARELGVSAMAIYHHVPSKAALLERIDRSARDRLPAVARASVKRAATLEAQPRLTEQRIVHAALEQVRKHGTRGLTMRALAEQLGVSPMALYHHVRNKEELLDLLRDAVIAHIELPEPSGQLWQQQMRDYALRTITELARYPDLLKPGTDRAPTQGQRRFTRHGIEILLAAGFEPRQAALGIATYHTHIFGVTMLMNHLALRGARASDKVRRRGASAAEEVRGHLRTIDFQTAVEHGIDTVLRGLAAELAEQTLR